MSHDHDIVTNQAYKLFNVRDTKVMGYSEYWSPYIDIGTTKHDIWTTIHLERPFTHRQMRAACLEAIHEYLRLNP